MNKEQTTEIVARIKVWMESPEGKRAIADSMRKLDEDLLKLREARRIDWRSLYQPMTI